MAAQVRIAKPPGVLPVANVSTQPSINGANSSAPASSGPRQAPSRLKVVIRRLAPGLTQGEFESALGEDWKVGGGKVGWAKYVPGKKSKDPAKPSKPSRAYLQLTSADHLPILSRQVSATKFVDAANTTDDSSLIGPPVLEFAPYSRIPSTKKRNDARQGTIDTDPEFIAFLESLTQAVVKPAPVDSVTGDAQTTAGGEKAEEEKQVTPLIQHLRDKKAAKEKAANAKASAKHSKGSKAEVATESKSDSKAGKEVADKKQRSTMKKEKVVTKENAKKQTKAEDAGTAQNKSQPDSTDPKRNTTKSARDTGASRRTESGGTSSRGSAAAALIQRDLGLRGGRGGTTSSSRSTGGERSKGSKSEPTNSAPKQATASATSPPQAAQAPSAVVATVKSPKSAAATPLTAPTQPLGQAPSRKTAITPGATSAFLKHANPSQGITEPLIQAAMSAYGIVNKVELDKRKGFAYVDFETSDALKAAVEAGSVKIAEGAVVVMERRERPPAVPSNKVPASTSSRGNRGGSSQQPARGGSTAQTTTPASTSVEHSSTDTTAAPAQTTTEAQAAQPPSGPASANTRGRGGRGSGFRGRGGRGRGRGSSAAGASGASGASGGAASGTADG